jgi:pseudaminic acid synthase
VLTIVAELSANHNGKIETALKACEAAKQAGADALKIQSYTPEGITLDRELTKLYKKGMTPRAWQERIFAKCAEIGLLCFSSPFSYDDADWLEPFTPFYKVASFELTDLPFIRYLASKGKPLILSTGMATLTEITEALRAAGNCDVTLLKCTSAYPAEAQHANLATLADLRHKFKHVKLGISDHTPGIGVSVAAVALGAEMVEKHFTVEPKGIDAAVSLMPEEFKLLVAECRRAYESIGRVHYGATEGELLQYRRSLWAVKHIPAGERFTAENVKSLRPAGGLEPKHLPNIIGKVAKCDVKKGEPLTWDCL